MWLPNTTHPLTQGQAVFDEIMLKMDHSGRSTHIYLHKLKVKHGETWSEGV